VEILIGYTYSGMFTRFMKGLCALLLVMLSGCAGTSVERAGPPRTPARDCCRAGRPVAKQGAIVRTAAGLVGAKTIESNGQRIAYDCAGVARAIYMAHGIDLYEGGDRGTKTNGVRLIYNHVRERGRIHQGPMVHPGDLVFFDNTWDYNRDGRANDPLTHVGIVERVEADGTIVFISRVADAIERYRMNLAQPHVHQTSDGRILNDYMRRKRWSDEKGTRYLTGELFASFGTRVAS
jgi:hypothetical protein